MTTNDYSTERVLHPVTTARLYREQLCFDEQATERVKTFLDSYQLAVRMLRLCREDERARAEQSEICALPPDGYGPLGGSAQEWLQRLRDVRAFIDSLPNRPTKMLLYYHYVRNLTVERAAEELDISRRAAFRLKKKALAFAAARYEQWQSDRVC